MKAIKKLILLICALAVAFGFAACDETAADPLDNVLIASVRIKTMPQAVFALGEAFNYNGLELEATYVNGHKRSFGVSGFVVDDTQYNAAVEGFYDIFVTLLVNGEVLSYGVRVGNPAIVPTSIFVQMPPAKVKYYLGEAFDESGLVVAAINNDKSTAVLSPSDYTVDSSAFNSASSGVYEIRIVLNADPSIFAVFSTLVQKEVAAISVRIVPQTEFFVGAEFNHSGLVIQAEFIDGSFADLSSGSYSVDNSEYNAKKNTPNATAAITITLRDKPMVLTSYNVRIFDASAIEIASTPSRDTYAKGENTLVLTGLAIRASYGTEGKSAYIPLSSCSINHAVNFGVNGAYPVTVSYKSLSASFNVFIESITAIEISTLPKKTQYLVGESFDAYGLMVLASFANAKKGLIGANLYSINSASYNEMLAGPYGITVVLLENTSITASFAVSVFSADAIRVGASSMHKTVFDYAEIFSFGGLVIEAEYGSGFVTQINLSNVDVDFSQYKRIATGVYPITVTLKGTTLACGYTVTVQPRGLDEVNYLMVGNGYDKRGGDSAHETLFALGEAFSADGLRVYGLVDLSEASIYPARQLSKGEYTVDSSAYNASLSGMYAIRITLNANPLVSAEYYVSVANANEVIIAFDSIFTQSNYKTRNSAACDASAVISSALNPNEHYPAAYNGYNLIGYYADSMHLIEFDFEQTPSFYTSGSRITVYARYELDATKAYELNLNSYVYSTNAIFCEYDEGVTFLDYYRFKPTTGGVFAIAGAGAALINGGMSGFPPVRIFEYSGNQKDPIDPSKEISCYDANGVYKGFSLSANRDYIITLSYQLFNAYRQPLRIQPATSITLIVSPSLQAELLTAQIDVVVPLNIPADTMILDVFGLAAQDLGGRFELYSDPAFSSVINYNTVTGVLPSTLYLDMVV